MKVESLNARDRAAFSELLDRCFGVPAGAHYLEDFAVWDFSESPVVEGRILRVAAWSDETPRRLAACAAVRLADLHTPAEKRLKVGIIGAVATGEAARGRGLASQLVSLCSEWARERGAALLLLWGSEHRLYERLGFELSGAQTRLPLAELLRELPAHSHSSPIREGWSDAIFAALLKRRTGLALGPEDRSWYVRHRNVRWFWAQVGEAFAYAALGRGIDLAHQVHEWGGDPELLQAVLHHIAALDPSAELLGSSVLITERWGARALPAEEFLALARILDPVALAKAHDRAPGTPTPALPAGTWIWGLDSA